MLVFRKLLYPLLFVFLVSCNTVTEYEQVAIDFTNAKYTGNTETMKNLSTLEAVDVYIFLDLLYTEKPDLKDINKDASCKVLSSELSEDGLTAKVTLEEKDVASGNIMSGAEPVVVNSKKTVLTLLKQDEKWLVEATMSVIF